MDKLIQSIKSWFTDVIPSEDHSIIKHVEERLLTLVRFFQEQYTRIFTDIIHIKEALGKHNEILMSMSKRNQNVIDNIDLIQRSQNALLCLALNKKGTKKITNQQLKRKLAIQQKRSIR